MALRRGVATMPALNRNFPDPIRDPGMERFDFEQPEVRAVMDWTLLMPGGFTASGALHEGELVVNYPWDGSASGQPVRNTTSDDATFRHLATAYARHNPPMRNSQVFAGGITNGAEWYPIHGGMQDWNYLAANCLELTLDLSTQKSPPASQLPSLFRNNLRSMLGFARTAALGGVRGRVLGNASATGLESELESGALGSDAPVPHAAVDGAGASQELGMQDGNLIPLEADVSVVGSDKVIRSRPPFGDFYRPLHPGRHSLVITSQGFLPRLVEVEVPDDEAGVEVEVVMERDD